MTESQSVTQVNILITTYRNHTKVLIAKVIDKHSDFDDDQPEYNRELVNWYLPDAFHEAVSAFTPLSICLHIFIFRSLKAGVIVILSNPILSANALRLPYLAVTSWESSMPTSLILSRYATLHLFVR